MPKRYRARLLNREMSQIHELLRGKRWGEFMLADVKGPFELDGYSLHIKIDMFLGQQKLALIAQGQFVAMQAVSFDTDFLWFPISGPRKVVLNPRIPPYGMDITGLTVFGEKDKLEAIKQSLIIEEPDETPDDPA